MHEENIVFQAGKLCIEGRYAESETLKGAVVAHPHPMLGGNMWNHVVEQIVTSLFNKGYSTLRFNFRGVGNSEGIYDDGFGEQVDIEAAADYLSKKGKTNVMLAGYSFGAWIISKVAARYDHFEHLVFISPPVKVLRFDFANINGGKCLIISGRCKARASEKPDVFSRSSSLDRIDSSRLTHSTKIRLVSRSSASCLASSRHLCREKEASRMTECPLFSCSWASESMRA